MKKIFLVMLTLLVMLAAAPVCWAADVPVYLDGERVASGLEQGGSTYLPLRTMFETVGAAVDWEEKTQTITAHLLSSKDLIMRIGSKNARLVELESGQETACTVEQPAFVRGGVTYVPLRFVTDVALGYDLDWRDNAVWLSSPKLKYTLSSGETFQLDQQTGEFSKNGQLLAKLDLPSLADPYSWFEPVGLEVRATAAGNYLVQARGIGSGALTFDYKLAAYVPAAGGEARTYCVHTIMLVDLPEPFQQGDNIWFSDDEIGAVCINDKTGEVSEYQASEIYQYEYATGYVWWADGNYLLLGDGASFDLYNLQNKTLQNTADLLVTPELKAQINEFMRNAENSAQTDEWYAEHYWIGIGNGMYSVDPYPSLQFVKAENGALHFTLRCRYWLVNDNGNVSMEAKEYPLAYQLPE